MAFYLIQGLKKTFGKFIAVLETNCSACQLSKSYHNQKTFGKLSLSKNFWKVYCTA